MFLVHTRLPHRESHDHEVGGIRFTFRPAMLSGRRRAMVARIGDDDVERVREAIEPHGDRFQILPDADVRVDGAPAGPAPSAAPGAPVEPALPSVRDIILRQGWEAADLDGLPPLDGNRLDRSAGCSIRAGLSAAEMMMITAPQGWPEHAHIHYPWEVPGFRPTPGFRAPSTGPKLTPPPLPGQGEAPPDDDKGTGADAPPPVAPPDLDPKRLDGDDPALTAYDADPAVVADARKALAAMLTGGGKPPSLSKANANFKAAHLPTTNAAGLQALLAPLA